MSKHSDERDRSRKESEDWKITLAIAVESLPDRPMDSASQMLWPIEWWKWPSGS